MPCDTAQLTTNTLNIFLRRFEMSTLPEKRKSFEVIINLIWIKNWEKQLCYGLN